MHFITERLKHVDSCFQYLSDKEENERMAALVKVSCHQLNCCVSIQALHPSEEHLIEGQLRHNAARRLSQFKGTSKCTPQCGLLFPVFRGCTATILHGLPYPRILCTPEKQERKNKNGNNARRRSSLSVTWAAKIAMKG